MTSCFLMYDVQLDVVLPEEVTGARDHALVRRLEVVRKVQDRYRQCQIARILVVKSSLIAHGQRSCCIQVLRFPKTRKISRILAASL
ncbi:MAG: hypothetical protein ABFD97_07775 [Syntrophobacter sp.]